MASTTPSWRSLLCPELSVPALVCYLVIPWAIQARVRAEDPAFAVAVDLGQVGAATRVQGGPLQPHGTDPWGNAYLVLPRLGGGSAGVVLNGRAIPAQRDLSPTHYSRGPNGEDDGGAGDDVVADARLVERYGIGTWSRAGVHAVVLDALTLLSVLLGFAAFESISRRTGEPTRRQVLNVAVEALFPSAILAGAFLLRGRGNASPLDAPLGQLEARALHPLLFLFGSYPLLLGVGVVARLRPLPAPPAGQPESPRTA